MMQCGRPSRWVALVLVGFMLAPGATALGQPRDPDAAAFDQPDANKLSGASRYRLDLEGEQSMIEFSVSVWGEVRRPGLYSVPEGTTLLDLISLAGGPTSSAKFDNVKLVRAATVSKGKKRVVNVDLNDFVEEGAAEVRTLLLPDDTVVIEAKRSTSLLKWTSFMSVLVLIGNVVVTSTK